MTLREIKKLVSTLTTRQLIRLDAWLHELIEAAESNRHAVDGASAARQVLEERRTITKTYRLEEVRCGKKNCHCAEGRLHGPHWYAYWTEGGRTKSQYVGKKLPCGVRKA
jgi:uncharacterized protein DUF6788